MRKPPQFTKWIIIQTIAIVTSKCYKLQHLNEKTTFINKVLKMYFKQPPKLVKVSLKHLVCKLNKILYGFKQVPKIWVEKTNIYFIRQELIKSFQDWTLYNVKKQDYISILIGYVDDLFTKNNKQNVEWIKIQLFSQFDMIDLATITSKYLSLEFKQNARIIFIHEKSYMQELLRDFKITNYNSTHAHHYLKG